MSDVSQDTIGRHLDRNLAAPPMRPRNRAGASAEADLKECMAAIRKGSKSFHLASLILPAETRKAAISLYAFCRHSDDLIDDPRSSRASLDQLRHRLDLAYRGTPAPFACDRAFARTAETYSIPKCIPDALLDGFAMDLANRRYRTIADVKEYATCVAATVGLMMALVMKTGSAQALARAADLGLAMQLTNIARDVGEDARNGRLYLPGDWLRESGVNPETFLVCPRDSPELRAVIRRLLEEANHHYRLGHTGISALPQSCRHAIRTAAYVYEEIGAEIAANGFDSVTSRAHTRKVKKLALMLKARIAGDAGASHTQSGFDTPPDPACAHLVAAGVDAFATHHPSPSLSEATAPTDTNLERFLTIMIKLQTESRQHHRLQRMALQDRSANRV